jgi:hypothetical protein
MQAIKQIIFRFGAIFFHIRIFGGRDGHFSAWRRRRPTPSRKNLTNHQNYSSDNNGSGATARVASTKRLTACEAGAYAERSGGMKMFAWRVKKKSAGYAKGAYSADKRGHLADRRGYPAHKQGAGWEAPGATSSIF